MATAETAGMTLRACAAGDIPEITAIYRREVLGGTASFEIEPPDEGEMERRRLALVAAGCPYLVAAAVDGAVLGYAYAGPYRPRPAYRFTLESSVYVRPDARGRGLGRLLLGALIESAEQRGFRQMVAVIGDSANRPSIALHEALGFVHASVFRSVGWKHERWLDTVLMQRPLGPGGEAPPTLPEAGA
ncbi:MAG: GNAT family N-acetyltransferase [Bauldia sp.]|nr:GNAT family N-acetyltransferase [Bauldia sp.]